MTARKSTKPDPSPLVGGGLGRVAYEAYSSAVDGKSVRGESLPTWNEQVREHPQIAAAWCAVGQAVITATIARKD
jgi:hypothetical protein